MPLAHQTLLKATASLGIAVAVHGALFLGFVNVDQNRTTPPILLNSFEVVELASSGAQKKPDPIEEIVEEIVKEPVVEKVVKPKIIPATIAKPSPVVVAKAKPKPKPKPLVKLKPKTIAKPMAKPTVKPMAKPTVKPVIQPKSETVSSRPAYVPPSQHAAYLKNPKPAYPTQARKRGMEGRVVLRVFVRADGGVKSVVTNTSSGYGLLDRAARVAVLRWRFAPATRGGKVVAGEVLIPFDFRLTSG